MFRTLAATGQDHFLKSGAEIGAVAAGFGALGGVLGLILGATASLIWPSADISVPDWVALGGALFALFALAFLLYSRLGV